MQHCRRTSVLAGSCVIAVASPWSMGPRFSPIPHHPAPLFHAQMHVPLVLIVFVILGDHARWRIRDAVHTTSRSPVAQVCRKLFCLDAVFVLLLPVSAVFIANCQLEIDLFTDMLCRFSFLFGVSALFIAGSDLRPLHYRALTSPLSISIHSFFFCLKNFYIHRTPFFSCS